MPTVKQLRSQATKQKIVGRSKMNKAQLISALNSPFSNENPFQKKKRAPKKKSPFSNENPFQKKRAPKKRKKVQSSINMADLLAAGYVNPPSRLTPHSYLAPLPPL